MTLTVLLVALGATDAVIARSHHRAPKRAAPAATTKAETKIPVEPNRDPADVALDRRIKGVRAKSCDLDFRRG
jgi:hypothetical protein